MWKGYTICLHLLKKSKQYFIFLSTMTDITEFKKKILEILEKIDKREYNNERGRELFRSILNKVIETTAQELAVTNEPYITIPNYSDILKSTIENAENELEVILTLFFAEYIKNLLRWSVNPNHLVAQEIMIFWKMLSEKIDEKLKEKEYFEGLPYA